MKVLITGSHFPAVGPPIFISQEVCLALQMILTQKMNCMIVGWGMAKKVQPTLSNVNEQNKNSNEESLMNEMVTDVKLPYVANRSGDASSGDPVPPVEQAQGPTGSPFVELAGSRDKNKAESEQLNVSASGVGTSSGVNLLPSDSAANMMPSKNDVNSANTTDFRKCSFVSGGVSPSTGKGKGLTLSSDSDLDSLPDIIDGDPDSD